MYKQSEGSLLAEGCPDMRCRQGVQAKSKVLPLISRSKNATKMLRSSSNSIQP